MLLIKSSLDFIINPISKKQHLNSNYKKAPKNNLGAFHAGLSYIIAMFNYIFIPNMKILSTTIYLSIITSRLIHRIPFLKAGNTLALNLPVVLSSRSPSHLV